ncbi:MAG: flagellar FlbD family protein, partial [Silvibacterium sp.]
MFHWSGGVAASLSPPVFSFIADKPVRESDAMIELTRLNGSPLAVNSDLIQFAESAPDTLLTMVTGEKLIVTESLAEVADRMVAY